MQASQFYRLLEDEADEGAGPRPGDVADADAEHDGSGGGDEVCARTWIARPPRPLVQQRAVEFRGLLIPTRVVRSQTGVIALGQHS